MKVTIQNGPSTPTGDAEPQMTVSGTEGPRNRYTTGQESLEGRSVLGTARDPMMGMAQAGSSINEDSIVTVQGIPMSVKQAMQHGLVVERPDGSLSDGIVDTGKAKTPEQLYEEQVHARQQAEAEAAAKEAPREMLDQQTEQTIADLTSVVGDAQMGAALSVLASGQELPDHMTSSIAQRLGTEPEGALQHVERIRSAFAEQAGRYIASTGFEPTEVYQWMQQNAPEVMADAAREQYYKRTTAGYAEVIKTYAEGLAQSNPEALLQANFGEGVELSRGPRGIVMVKVGSMTTDWRTAVRMGLIKFSNVHGGRQSLATAQTERNWRGQGLGQALSIKSTR